MSDPLNQHEVSSAQRERLLAELLAEMVRLHRRRATRRRAMLTATPIIALAVIASFWLGPRPNPRAAFLHEPPAPHRPQTTQATHAISESRIVHVRTDPAIVERWRATSTPRIVMLDDDALLHALAAMNRPAGLIRSEGKVWLTADVTGKQDNSG